MTLFFPATSVAAKALYGDFKLKAYYDSSFHLESMTCFACHLVRALYNIAKLLISLIKTLCCLLIPLFWPAIPLKAPEVLDHVGGLALSLLTITLYPLIVLSRSLVSMVRGYEKNSDYDWGQQQEEDDLALAMRIA